MAVLTEIFGANALIYMKYFGEINDLAKILSKGLMLPEFIVERSEYPPHNLSGSCEAMGFELWLEITDISEFPYLLKLETELSTNEIFHNKMHDLSPWLARYVSKICKIDSLVFAQDKELKRQLFCNGQVSSYEMGS